jgi:hypothetical protein
MHQILINQAKCTKCGDTPISTHRHDYVECSCGNIAVDGGMEYLKRSGDLSGYEDMSVSLDKDLCIDIVKAISWCHENGRNELGILCAVVRAIRDNGYKIVKV